MAHMRLLALLSAFALATVAGRAQEILPAPPVAQPNPLAPLPEGTVIGP